MSESVNLVQAFSQILRALITRSRSQFAGLIVFSSVLLADSIFRIYLFPLYNNFLQKIGAKPVWTDLDVVFSPIVWLSFFAIILGSLTIVITFASQNVPKLIDIYMDHWPSLFFVWWGAACLIHSFTIKVLSEVGVEIVSSIIFNYHVLLAVSLVIGFPFIFSILKSTKTSDVIENLLNVSYARLKKIAKKGTHGKISQLEHSTIQYHLFEELNQLMDLLVFVQYKEPKAQILEGIGELLRFYVKLKPRFPEKFFKINQKIHDDISFRTLKNLLAEVEKSHTFYEQKIFRLIGNVYNIFLEKGEFDLSTLCVEQLSQVGKTAIEYDDHELIEIIIVRFNTYLRFALKHGQHNNEPRNLYNLVFHYGQFLNHLVENNQVDRVKKCLDHFVFYGQQCFNGIPRARSLVFILDILASEMQKIMQIIFQNNWEREMQKELLQKFLLFDNFQDIDKKVAIQFISQNHGIRLLHIGLALFYLDRKEEEFAVIIAKDTLQDILLLGKPQFFKTMDTIFARLQFSGEKFWEDTDRGNVNIYYTPFQKRIEYFKKLQEVLIYESQNKITA